MTGPLDPFLRLQHLVRVSLREELAQIDLTPAQSTLLHLVGDHSGASSAELARVMRVTPQTMHRLAALLEQRGLLSSQPRAGHGRARDLAITTAGRDARDAADLCGRKVQSAMVAALDAEDVRAFGELLQRCADNFTTASEAGPPPVPTVGSAEAPAEP